MVNEISAVTRCGVRSFGGSKWRMRRSSVAGMVNSSNLLRPGLLGVHTRSLQGSHEPSLQPCAAESDHRSVWQSNAVTLVGAMLRVCPLWGAAPTRIWVPVNPLIAMASEALPRVHGRQRLNPRTISGS